MTLSVMEGRCKLHKNFYVTALLVLLMLFLGKATNSYSITKIKNSYLATAPPISQVPFSISTKAEISKLYTPKESLYNTVTPSSINLSTDGSTSPSGVAVPDDSTTTPPAVITDPNPSGTNQPNLPPSKPNTHPTNKPKKQNVPAPSSGITPSKVLDKTQPKSPKGTNKSSAGNALPKDKNSLKTSPELYINSLNLLSSTSYLIWIDTAAQKLYVFSKDKLVWKIKKTFLCATGKDSTPTIKGTFKSSYKAFFVYDKKYNCYLKYVTQIYKGYLIHSVILDKDGNIIDGTLGQKKSHGCVRLSLTDSKWIYTALPLNTTIYIT